MHAERIELELDDLEELAMQALDERDEIELGGLHEILYGRKLRCDTLGPLGLILYLCEMLISGGPPGGGRRTGWSPDKS